MLLLGAVFVLYLVSFSQGLNYEDLSKDECFKKLYVCGDHRVSITGGTGRLVTEPYKFGEVCRRHKEFIACIDDASHFCANNFTDLALMTFDNRRSVKMFCTDFEWRKNYFQSAGCINRREQEVKNECRLEEEERIDDRPWWCLIPEPCEAIQRVFDCTVQKMEKRCGSIAAEVYRRIHLLKVENQDVVCQFRLQNPRYCRYQRATKTPYFKEENYRKKEFTRRTGSLKSSPSESMSNLISETIIDSVRLLHKMKLLSLKFQDSETFLLKNLLNINYKLKKLLRDFFLSHEGVNESHSNDYADKTSSAYQTLTFDNRIHFIKDTVFKLYELFNDNKDLRLISDDRVEFSWKDLQEFPIDHMSCFWLKSSRNAFKCDIKVMYSKQDAIYSDFDYNLWKHMSDVSDVEDLFDYPEFDSSSIDDSEEFKPVYHFKENVTHPLVFISIDDSIFISSLNLSDIRRNGLQFEDSEDTDSNWKNDELRSYDSVLDDIKKVKYCYFLWNVINTESTPSENSEEQPNSCAKENRSFKYTINEKYKLRKLEEGLHKRFLNLDIVSEIKDAKSRETFCELSEAIKEGSCPNVNSRNCYEAKTY